MLVHVDRAASDPLVRIQAAFADFEAVYLGADVEIRFAQVGPTTVVHALVVHPRFADMTLAEAASAVRTFLRSRLLPGELDEYLTQLILDTHPGWHREPCAAAKKFQDDINNTDIGHQWHVVPEGVDL